MKTIICRSFVALLLLTYITFARPEIINENVIKQSSLDKITEIANELYLKTGVSVVAHLVADTHGIVEYEKNISASLKAPYVLVVFSAKEQKVDMTVSDDLQKIVNKNEILNTYIIPILVAGDKNSVDAKYSAAMLNGVAEIADEIAASRGVKLDSSIGSDSRNFMQGLRALFYGIIVVSLGIYFYRIYQRRRAV
jgi:hypothetical protein